MSPAAILGVCFWTATSAQVGTVRAEQKISRTIGGLSGLPFSGLFGWSVAGLGDLDGDGNPDLAAGSLFDGDGAVRILFLDVDGTVKASQKIGESSGGFGGQIDPSAGFGVSVAALGDLDVDGNIDVAVGAFRSDGGGIEDQGALWILFLNADGTVKSWQKISQTTGGFGGDLDRLDVFGTSLANLGDLDLDGVVDLAVGAKWDDDGGTDQGALWILFFPDPADGECPARRERCFSASQ